MGVFHELEAGISFGHHLEDHWLPHPIRGMQDRLLVRIGSLSEIRIGCEDSGHALLGPTGERGVQCRAAHVVLGVHVSASCDECACESVITVTGNQHQGRLSLEVRDIQLPRPGLNKQSDSFVRICQSDLKSRQVRAKVRRCQCIEVWLNASILNSSG